MIHRRVDYLVIWGNNVGNMNTYYLKKDRTVYAKYVGKNSIVIMQSPESDKHKYIDTKNIEYTNSILASKGGFTDAQRNEALIADRETPIGQHIEFSNINYVVVGYIDPNSSLEWIGSVAMKGKNPHTLNEYINIKIINPDNVDDDLELDESLIREASEGIILRYTISLVCVVWGIISLILTLRSKKA